MFGKVMISPTGMERHYPPHSPQIMRWKTWLALCWSGRERRIRDFPSRACRHVAWTLPIHSSKSMASLPGVITAAGDSLVCAAEWTPGARTDRKSWAEVNTS